MIQNSIVRSLTLFMLVVALAFWSFGLEAQPKYVWGAATNGVQLGLGISQVTGWRTNGVREFLCEIVMQNVSTNRITLRFATDRERNEILLHTLGGGQVQLLTQHLPVHMNQQIHPILLTTNDIAEVNWFFLTDIFKVQTNGTYSLIVTERATTNNILVKKPFYFSFPPVTNTFTFSR